MTQLDTLKWKPDLTLGRYLQEAHYGGKRLIVMKSAVGNHWFFGITTVSERAGSEQEAKAGAARIARAAIDAARGSK